MLRILAIAGQSIKAAFRSKAVLSLGGALLIVLLGLPAAIESDGTVEGRLAIIITYTLGLSSAILAVASLWAGSAAISLDVQFRHAILVAVKPVRKIEIWLGKWLGLLAINAIALCAVGAAVYGFVQHSLHTNSISNQQREEIVIRGLSPKSPVLPGMESVADEADAEFDRLAETGGIPPGLDRSAVLRRIQNNIRARKMVVPPGQTRTWSFDLPKSKLRADKPLLLGFSLSRVTGNRRPVTGIWRMPTAGGGVFEHSLENCVGGEHFFAIPRSVIRPNATDPESRVIEVEFANGSKTESNTAFFDRDEPVRLLVARGSFEGNLVRSLAVLFFRLALLTAIGVTAGAFFSFPVAVFVSFAIVLASMGSNYYTAGAGSGLAHSHHHHGPPPEKTVLHVASEKGAQAFGKAVRPIMDFRPIEKLSSGMLISAPTVARAFILLGALCPALSALLGALCLNRRELGLPVSGS